jgi:adenylosuccinate lyase
MPSEEDLKKALATLEAAKAEALKPKPLELDEYEKLYIDNILFRELAAKRLAELASRDMHDVNALRAEIIKKLRAKHGVDPTWQIVIDQQKKTASAEPPKS